MSTDIEKIEELRKRSKLSYEEASNLLKKHNNDLVEAIIELEKSKKIDEDNCCMRHKEGVSRLKRLFRKGNKVRLIITKNEESIANISVNYVIAMAVLAFHFMIFSLILVFATGCKMGIKRCDGEVLDVDDAIIDVAKKVKENAQNFAKEGVKSEGIDLSKDNKKNEEISGEKGYNEYTVE